MTPDPLDTLKQFAHQWATDGRCGMPYLSPSSELAAACGLPLPDLKAVLRDAHGWGEELGLKINKRCELAAGKAAKTSGPSGGTSKGGRNSGSPRKRA